jgi:hypothetical protein
MVKSARIRMASDIPEHRFVLNAFRHHRVAEVLSREPETNLTAA